MTKRTTLLLFLAGLLLAIGMYLGRHRLVRTSGIKTVAPTVVASPSVSPHPAMGIGAHQDSRKSVLEKQAIILGMFATGIDFFGKVVDEKGNPVAGASVSYIVTTLSFNGSPTQTGPKSGADGRFSISGERGPEVEVMVTDSDYYETESSDQIFSYAGPADDDSSPVPTSENPAIFVLHAKGRAEPLLHSKLAKYHLPMDGSPVSVDLDSGRIGEGKDSITLALQSDGGKVPINDYFPFSWRLTIQVPGGGIQERADELQFVAPSGDYQASISFGSDGSLPVGQWKDELQHGFFLRLSSGNYARIDLTMVAIKGSCTIDCYVNPAGSRNLEYDPNLGN